MSVQLPITFGSVPTSSSLFTDFVTALINLDEQLGAALRRAEGVLDEADKHMGAVHEAMRRAIDVAAATAALISVTEWDRVIAQLEEAESGLRTDDEKMDRLVDQAVKIAKRVRPGAARRLAPLVRRYRDLAAANKEQLRDARWQLMALRAERFREEKGPVFADPADLRQYLSALTPRH